MSRGERIIASDKDTNISLCQEMPPGSTSWSWICLCWPVLLALAVSLTLHERAVTRARTRVWDLDLTWGLLDCCPLVLVLALVPSLPGQTQRSTLN